MAEPAKSKEEKAVEAKAASQSDLASEIQKRAKTFASKMNSGFDSARKTCLDNATKALEAKLKKEGKETELAKKKEELKKKIPTFKMELDTMRVSAEKRSGKDQAWYAIKGWSRTCRSAHLHHAAIHIKTTVTRGSKSKIIGLSDINAYYPTSFKPADHLATESWGIMSYAEFTKLWAKNLSAAVLADCTGNSQAFKPADPWHVELPSSKIKGIPDAKKTASARPGFSDKEVIACIDHYAEYSARVDAISDAKKKTRFKKNTSIEKNYPKTYKSKYETHKKKLDATKKKVEKDEKKKAKLEEENLKAINKMKGRMDKTYDEAVKLKEAKEVSVP